MTDTALPTTGGWRATTLAHLPVVEVRGGQTLGQVADLVFDPGASTIEGVLVASQGRNASLLEAVRRTFGGTMGLTYVGLDHVLSLNSDVVTVELSETPVAPPHGPLPRLSGVLHFDVITLLGRRLGRLADLLLDTEGRRIVGYLVQPTGPRSDTAQPATPVAPAAPEGMPELMGEEPATTPAATLAPATPPLIVVGSDQGVRIGRDLIIIAGAASGAGTAAPIWSATGASAKGTPLDARRAHSSGEASPVDNAVADTGWQVYDPDAPTEHIRT